VQQDDLQFLKSVYKSPVISNDGYETLYEAHEKIRFKKGDVLLRDGEIANTYILIASGLLRKYVIDVDGNEVTTRFHARGEFSIVVLSFFQLVSSSENIVALTEGAGWKMTHAVFVVFV